MHYIGADCAVEMCRYRVTPEAEPESLTCEAQDSSAG